MKYLWFLLFYSGYALALDYEGCMHHSYLVTKNNEFADLMRDKCFIRFSDKFTYDSCMKHSSKLSTTAGKDRVRGQCFGMFHKKFTYAVCMEHAAKMGTPPGMDSVRDQCFDKFHKNFTYEACIGHADQMSTSSGRDRVRGQCTSPTANGPQINDEGRSKTKEDVSSDANTKKATETHKSKGK